MLPRLQTILFCFFQDSDSDLSGVEIKCSGNVGDTGCQSGASIDSSYASRLDLSVGTSSCGLSIRDPQPEDNGDWECHVLGQDLSGSQRCGHSYVTLFCTKNVKIQLMCYNTFWLFC